MHLHMHHSLPETSINCKISATIPSSSTKRCCTFHHHLQSSTSSWSLRLPRFITKASLLPLQSYCSTTYIIIIIGPPSKSQHKIKSLTKKKAEGEEIQTVSRILRLSSMCTNSGCCVLGHGIMKVESRTLKLQLKLRRRSFLEIRRCCVW